MTLLFQLSFVNSLNIQSNDAYVVATNQSGLVVGSTLVNDAQTSMAVWGDDSFSPEIDGASEGDTIILSLVDGISLINVFPLTVNNAILDLSYVTNGFLVLSNVSTELSCIYDPNSGCTDNYACNYNPSSSLDDGSCIYLEGECDECVDGVVNDNDIDNDGICDIDEIPGCMDESACNFNPLATDPPLDVNTLVNPTDCYFEDTDNDGICDIFETVGCTDAYACNYDATLTTDTDNSLCIFAIGCDTCSGETDGTGIVVDNNDLDDDGVCNDDEVLGCTDSLACTYSDLATEEDNSLCIFAIGCDTCSGETDGTGIVVDNDLDDDGVCNDDEVMGCTDSLSCTYSDLATEEDNSCLYFDSCGECGGNDNCAVFIEADLTIFVDSTLVSDSVALESFENNFEDLMETQLGLPEGCVVVIQINFLNRGEFEIEVIYTITLTEDEIQETDINPNLTPEEIISEINEDISVFEDEDVFEDIEFIEGCTNNNACNFNVEANIEAECFVPEGCDVCSGETNDGSGFILTNDLDGDGVCDIDEIIGKSNKMQKVYNSLLPIQTIQFVIIQQI